MKFIKGSALISIIIILTFTLGCISVNSPPTLEPFEQDFEAMDTNAFRAVMEANGYEILDITYQYEEPEAVHYYLFVTNDNYSLEFIEFYFSRYAHSVFMSFRDRLIAESDRAFKRIQTECHLGTFNLFYQISRATFSYVYRFENIILYVTADEEYENHARELISSILVR